MFDAEKFAALPIFATLSRSPGCLPTEISGVFMPYICLFTAPLFTVIQSKTNCTYLVNTCWGSCDGCTVRMFDGRALRNT